MRWIDNQVKVIVFDIDGTLSPEISWLKLTESLGADVQTHEQIFADFKRGQLEYVEAKKALLQLWQKTGKANKAELSQIFLKWNLKPDAVDIITYLKAKYQVILISGSMDTYVEVVAEKLAVETWYANTSLVWDEQGELVDFTYEANQAQKKVSQLQEFLAVTGHSKSECLVIGDGDSDLALFKELSWGIAVNAQPYPELEKLAWKKVTQLREIQQLL